MRCVSEKIHLSFTQSMPMRNDMIHVSLKFSHDIVSLRVSETSEIVMEQLGRMICGKYVNGGEKLGLIFISVVCTYTLRCEVILLAFEMSVMDFFLYYANF